MDARRAAHLNLIDSSVQMFALDSGHTVEDAEGRVFGAGTHPHPAITNVAFRRDDDADAAELVAAAKRFFGERDRGFSVFVRGEEPADEDLAAAAEAAG